MRIVCLGSAAQDSIDAANRRYQLTSSTSQGMLDFFNANGGNTPITRPTIASKSDDPDIFKKAWGIFEKLGTIASPAPRVTVVAPSGPPIAAMAAVGLAALLLYKAVK